MTTNLGLSKSLYRTLYLIRECELEIIRWYHEDEMKTPMHMSMGEEAIVVGLCAVLNKTDPVFGTYRSHALYLAKTMDTDDFFAELYARDSAFLQGKGGSMHLCAPEHGLFGTSAIVGSAIAVGVGTAFANKIKRNEAVTAVFFGDGAIDEGGFWESLNIACVKQVPVMFVCQDNGFAVHTPGTVRHGYQSISQVARQFNCRVFESDSTDVEVIYALALEGSDFCRKTQSPCFLHLKYYRYLEHVGINKDFEAGYRDEKDYQTWLKKDPLKLQREHLLDQQVSEAELKKLEDGVNQTVEKSLMKAKNAPLSNAEEIYKGVFS